MKLLSSLFAIVLTSSVAFSQGGASPSATVPITLDHNRIIIDVYFPMPDGSKTRARAWVDPGDTEVSITEALLKKLGLGADRSGDNAHAQPPRELLIGDMKIDLTEIKQARLRTEESIAPGTSASIKLPATVLRNYDLLIDYLNREFSIAQPGNVHFEGNAVKASVGPATGLIQLDCGIAGKKYTVSFDPGTSVSWLSGELISQWHKQHPQWPFMIGAVGPANLWGFKEEPDWTVLRIPQIQCGAMDFTNAVAVPLSKDTLDWFQKRAGVSTIGLIGADVLLNYRVGIDYAHSTVYLKQLSRYTPPGIEVVGLTLRPEEDGKYTVIAIANYQGKSSAPEVMIGDKLMTVNGARVGGGTMGQVWSLLSGSPGDVRTLGLVRDGKAITVQAKVYRFLPAVKVEAKTKNH